MKTKADVAIIGCGEAGIFAGYELKKLHPELEIVVVEQGKDIYSRKCPIVAGKVKTCVHCKTCDTMCGFGGAGTSSTSPHSLAVGSPIIWNRQRSWS